MELNPKAQSLFRLQSYGERPAIAGVAFHALRRFHDDGGSMTELVRLADGEGIGLGGFRPAQVNYSCLEPGAIKAFHLHREQTDLWFVPPEDRVLVVLVDVRAGSATEGERIRAMLGDGDSALVRIPPGVAHGCRNLGRHPARILYLTDRHFAPEPERCDEGRLPWDFLGKEIWDLSSD